MPFESHVLARQFEQRDRNETTWDSLDHSDDDPNMARRFPGT